MHTQLSPAYPFKFLGQHLLLLPQKAIYWSDTSTLIIADIHLGKVNHFRKAGIAIPGQPNYTDLQILEDLLKRYSVRDVIFLGDLFHSYVNASCAEFSVWIEKFPEISFKLVKGNHDLLPENYYHTNKIQVYTDTLFQTPFLFSHIPLEEGVNGYNLAGHIHPAVRLKGKGKQNLQLPCFYFGKSSGILPAFGAFTGNIQIKVDAESYIFAIGANQVWPVKIDRQA